MRRALFAALPLTLASFVVLAHPTAGRAAGAGTVRVGLVERASETLVSASVPADLVDAQGRRLAQLEPMAGWQARAEGGVLVLAGPGGALVRVSGAAFLRPLEPAGIPLVFADGRWLRGALEFRPQAGAVTVVNHVPLESYLYGVVPAEMPKSWHLESLKSQSVAARSYALANMGKHRARGYDLCDTDDCQVYLGASAEGASSNQAIDATKGEVITYNGKVIPAYFHASAGGYTENAEDVWSQKLPFIRAVPDFDQDSPVFSWYKNVSGSDLAANLAKKGVDVGEIKEIRLVERSYSGRVKLAEVVGTAGARRVRGDTLRWAASLKSTLFNVGATEGGAFTFAGRGWGHGLGLSQWGAKALSEKGYSYLQILGHYYPGAQLGRQD